MAQRRVCRKQRDIKKKLKNENDSSQESEQLPVHYFFNLFCFQFRLVSIEYFMDQMPVWEINDLIANIPYLDRNLWESSRLQLFAQAQTHSTKQIEITDLLKFKWDPGNETQNTEMSREDKIRLQNKAKMLENQIKNYIQRQ